MHRSRIFVALGGFCAASSAQAQPSDKAVVRHADGSFTITRPIEAEPPSAGWDERAEPIATAAGTAEDAAALLDREAAEADLERAYEEAVDFTRSEATAAEPQ